MDLLVDVLIIAGELVVLPLMIAAIVIGFLKGHLGAAWAGVAFVLIAAAGWFPLFREARDRQGEAWLLVPMAIGVVALVLVGRAVLRPARPGSRWASRETGTRIGLDRS